MEFVTSISGMLMTSNDFSQSQKSLITYKAAVQRVKINYPGINTSLKRISEEIENESQLMQQMALILEHSTNLYQKYEGQILKLECKPLTQNEENNITSGSEQESKDKGENYIATWSNLWKIIGNFGGVGSVISGIGSYITGDGSVKDNISSAKYFVSAVGNGAVAISKGGSEGVKYAIGLNDAMAKINTESFGTGVKSSIANQLDDLNFAKANGTAGKIKTATKWAGNILTVAANGVENYTEYKDEGISAERAIKETVIESAVDIAIGIGATAVVTGVLSAIGVAAAPAVLVGGAAAAITIGANAVCKWATGGKDVGEVVADFVCDIGEGVANVKEKAKGTIKNRVTAVWSGICGAFG